MRRGCGSCFTTQHQPQLLHYSTNEPVVGEAAVVGAGSPWPSAGDGAGGAAGSRASPPPRRRKMAVLVRAKPERRRRRGSRAAPRRSPSATTDPSASAPRFRPDDALAVLGERGEMSSGPRRWNAREIISMRGTERTNERTGEGGGQCLGSVAVCGRRSRCVRRHRSVGVAPGPGGDRS